MNMMTNDSCASGNLVDDLDITFRPQLKLMRPEDGLRWLRASDEDRDMVSTVGMQIAYRDAAIAWLLERLREATAGNAKMQVFHAAPQEEPQDESQEADDSVSDEVVGEMDAEGIILVDDIFDVVSHVSGVSRKVIISRTRRYSIVPARKAVCLMIYVLREDFSLPMIGRILKRDHSTILHAIRSALEDIEAITIAMKAARLLGAERDMVEGIRRLRKCPETSDA